VDFNREIRPILAGKCYACHGPDEDSREAGLRLDTREGATMDLGGYAAVEPGRPEAGALWKRIHTNDADDIMPPPSSPKKITAQDRELLGRWIREGAVYETHWSFVPVQRVKPPGAEADHPVDRFIQSRLARLGLVPAPSAEPHQLVRRLYLDLIGLPPMPEEVEAYAADTRPGAYERLVDRLLASPHFGERWGRHWLDLARYADSDGFLGDKVRAQAWRFRDWVVEAVNRDLPFDEFTVEQLAGDLLPERQLTQLVATGFHRNAPRNTEAGVDKEEARFQMLADRVNTTGRVWLGLTVGCAQCHTHKYDPITIRDYYSLYAFFNNTEDVDEAGTKSQTLAEVTKKRRDTYVHLAGDYSRRGPAVVPAGLSALPPMTVAQEGMASRLDLAKWLVDPASPLTSRVAVNQVWSKLFGQGIVPTPDDFGASGEPPTHPELLDWLATEFMAQGWSRKKLVRLIVTSATYRQSSAHRADLVEVDPLNRLLARQNRLRLEAEILRDAFLKTGGLLSPVLGGPSIRPPLPGDVTDIGRSVKWEVSKGAERYRRGLYILLLRSVMYPMLSTFDAPDASESCVRRERSNTPLQALALMNDPAFVEAAQALARRAGEEAGPEVVSRIRHLFRLTLVREPRAEEIERLMEYYAEQRTMIENDGTEALKMLGSPVPGPESSSPAEQVDLAALVPLARVLLNLDEFINRE
jgi:hypothetical protein